MLGDFLEGLWDDLTCWFKDAMCWIMDLIFDVAFYFVQLFLNLLPTSQAFENYNSVISILNAVEAWVPISYGFILLSAYGTFMVGFISVKLIFKALPAVG